MLKSHTRGRLGLITILALAQMLTFLAFQILGSPPGWAAPTNVRAHYRLRIRVKNPNCPDCLKTLKSYLLKINGVGGVRITAAAPGAPTVDLVVTMSNRSLRSRIIQRVRAHDLLIINTSG